MTSDSCGSNLSSEQAIPVLVLDQREDGQLSAQSAALPLRKRPHRVLTFTKATRKVHTRVRALLVKDKNRF